MLAIGRFSGQSVNVKVIFKRLNLVIPTDRIQQNGSMTCHQLTSQQFKIHQPKLNKKSIHQIPIQQ